MVLDRGHDIKVHAKISSQEGKGEEKDCDESLVLLVKSRIERRFVKKDIRELFHTLILQGTDCVEDQIDPVTYALVFDKMMMGHVRGNVHVIRPSLHCFQLLNEHHGVIFDIRQVGFPSFTDFDTIYISIW